MAENDAVLQHLLDISERLGSIENQVGGLVHELKGNGQPGRIQLLEEGQHSLDNKISAVWERVKVPESVNKRAAAFIAALVYVALFAARKAWAYVIPLVHR